MKNVNIKKHLSSFKVRKIKQKDFKDTIHLLNDYMSKFLPDQNLEKTIFKNFQNQSHVHGIVVEHKNRIIAYGCIIFEIKIRGSKIGHIEDIVTHKKYRNLGVGSLIVRELCELGKKEGCYKLCLASYKEAVEFYEKNGFIQSGSEALYFPI